MECYVITFLAAAFGEGNGVSALFVIAGLDPAICHHRSQMPGSSPGMTDFF
jgi:hypothetical protein